jgi:hypothetical protein
MAWPTMLLTLCNFTENAPGYNFLVQASVSYKRQTLQREGTIVAVMSKVCIGFLFSLFGGYR